MTYDIAAESTPGSYNTLLYQEEENGDLLCKFIDWLSLEQVLLICNFQLISYPMNRAQKWIWEFGKLDSNGQANLQSS